jgi:hypothetical protein
MRFDHNDSGFLVVPAIGYDFPDAFKYFITCSSGEYIRMILRYPSDYTLNLRDGFPLAKDHLGDTGSNAAMVVNLSEAEVLKREFPQPMQCFVKIDAAASDQFQKGSQLVTVHR